MSNSATTKPSPKDASTQGAGTAVDKKGDATSPGGTMKKQGREGTAFIQENYSVVSPARCKPSRASARFFPRDCAGPAAYAA
jgi:hypothetical protein